MNKLKSILTLGMILALIFTLSEAEAKKKKKKQRHSAPRCQGMIVNCSKNTDIMKCLTCNATGEALYKEGIDAMIRVNRVAIARSTSGQYPKNICSVIYQKAQFSWTTKPKICTSQKVWAQAQKAAKLAYQRKGNGKLFFHADYIKPKWARYCVGKEQPRGDTHIYYSQCFSNSRQLARYKRTNPHIASVDGYSNNAEVATAAD